MRVLYHGTRVIFVWSPLAGASRHHGDIAQLGEHLLCKQGVEGSNPFISTNRVASFSAMAYPGLDCVLFRTVRVIIARNSYNYDHEDERLVRAAWTSELHGASSSRKNAVSSGEIGCDIGEEHHPRQSPLLTTSTGWEMGNRCQ